MFTAIFILIGFPILIVYCFIEALCGSHEKSKPTPNQKEIGNITTTNSIDDYGDYNYGDIDWFKDGKL